ncbi:hypothetical protein F503_07558 [Ophiostoma piceae UAMH 11346]|uniref:Uncharacterized protein n=1 Tax=Ophiostoma piceae (strain UAMH 11346) TaxID=1262450 RepID=S3CAA6_OPHP1|nr:hypothetical protein F503_07558 [Ophiostoma piceae UAMH 11346]
MGDALITAAPEAESGLTSAARSFASIPELLMCVVDTIDDRTHLGTLRLVSSTLAEIIVPRLFADFHVCSNGEEGVHLEALLNDNALDKRIFRHVRRLNVRAWSHKWFESETGHMVAEQLLPFMPDLEAFRWDQGFITAETVAALHTHCPKLKELSIEYQQGATFDFDDDELQQLFTYELPDFTVFYNLQSLTLRYFDGKCMWKWREQLAKLCQNSCHTLKHLHLSPPESLDNIVGYGTERGLPGSMKLIFDDETSARPGTIANNNSWPNLFYTSLFYCYTETGAAPLQLDSLNLGLATWRFTREALCKFVDLRNLKEVVLGGMTTDAFESEDDDMPFREHSAAACHLYREGGDVLPVVASLRHAMMDATMALYAINPLWCPNLRGISTFHTSLNIHYLLVAASWVNMDWLRQLAIMSRLHHPFWTLARDPYDFLPPLLLLPRLDVERRFTSVKPIHLRMMSTPYDPYSTFRRSRLLRDQTGVVQHESDPKPGAWQVPEPNPTPDMMFDDIVSADDGTLEGLHVRIKMLLPACLLSPKIAKVIGPQLGRLQNLSQLMIKFDTHPAPDIGELELDILGTITANVRGDIESSKYSRNLVKEYGNDADLVLSFVKYSPSLQYVKVTETAWRVLRNVSGDVSGLKQLDKYENNTVELFRLHERSRRCSRG